MPTPRRTRPAAALAVALVAGLLAANLAGGSEPPAAGFGSGPATLGPPAPGPDPEPNTAPTIVDFAAEEILPGVFRFTGRVVDEAPANLTITFGGVPSARGKTAITGADGKFSVNITLRRDGTDAGTVTAKTKDFQGLPSNTASVDVAPTPP
ncbi:MAG: hypothetical protein K2X87_18910 [Gemmataceae bacterium]|nr:hypothetical protein [Gemmataceae bacterium]